MHEHLKQANNSVSSFDMLNCWLKVESLYGVLWMLCFSSSGLSVTEGQADMTGGKPRARADVTALRQRCRLDSVLRRATETKFFFLPAHNEDF